MQTPLGTVHRLLHQQPVDIRQHLLQRPNPVFHQHCAGGFFCLLVNMSVFRDYPSLCELSLVLASLILPVHWQQPVHLLFTWILFACWFPMVCSDFLLLSRKSGLNCLGRTEWLKHPWIFQLITQTLSAYWFHRFAQFLVNLHKISRMFHHHFHAARFHTIRFDLMILI